MNSAASLGARPQHNLASTAYERHKPEETLLYQLVEQYYPDLRSKMEEQGSPLPRHVQEEFDAYLKCGRLEHGFLRVRCESCFDERLVAFSCKRRGFCPSCCGMRMVESAAHLVDEVLPTQPMRQWVLSVPYPLRLLFAREPKILSDVLGIVSRAISSFLIKRAGETHKTACTGSVTLIQRFGSALNLNIHFHMLFLDGVYIKPSEKNDLCFKKAKAFSTGEIQMLTERISRRVLDYMERQGLIERDIESSYLSGDLLAEEDSMLQLQGHSITYRIAVGPQKGQKVLTLQLMPATKSQSSSTELLGKVAGFSLHAGVAVSSKNRKKLERICRYITRPSVSTQRLSLTRNKKVRYELKTQYRDGTPHVKFEPLDFVARMAALVPNPRVNLTRFHGVFAPNSPYRRLVIPKRIEKVSDSDTSDDKGHSQDECERRAKMTWAKRLKRVFDIEITVCEHCGGKVKIISCIEDRATIDKILSHVRKKEAEDVTKQSEARAPPQSDLLSNI